MESFIKFQFLKTPPLKIFSVQQDSANSITSQMFRRLQIFMTTGETQWECLELWLILSRQLQKFLLLLTISWIHTQEKALNQTFQMYQRNHGAINLQRLHRHLLIQLPMGLHHPLLISVKEKRQSKSK